MVTADESVPLYSGNVPGIRIGDNFIPFYSGYGGLLYAWALLNLIMSLIGIILGIIAGVRAILINHREQEESETEEVLEDEEYERREHTKRSLRWLALTFIMAIAGVLIFILTQDMRLPMVIVDRWSILNAIILAAEIVAVVHSFKRKQHISDAEETEEHEAVMEKNLEQLLEDTYYTK